MLGKNTQAQALLSMARIKRASNFNSETPEFKEESFPTSPGKVRDGTWFFCMQSRCSPTKPQPLPSDDTSFQSASQPIGDRGIHPCNGISGEMQALHKLLSVFPRQIHAIILIFNPAKMKQKMQVIYLRSGTLDKWQLLRQKMRPLQNPDHIFAPALLLCRWLLLWNILYVL